MQDEMDNQDTMISRLNKEKKQLQDSNQKTAEDLQVNFKYFEKSTKFDDWEIPSNFCGLLVLGIF